MPNLREIETHLKDKQEIQLRSLLNTRGISVSYLAEDKSLHKEIYGVHGSTSTLNLIRTFKALVLGDDYMPTDFASSTMFEEGLMYCFESNLRMGHYIKIDVSDKNPRAYKLINKETYGTTREVIYRYKLASASEQT